MLNATARACGAIVCQKMHVCVRVSVCVCVRERERGSMLNATARACGARMCQRVYVCVRERESVCVRERETERACSTPPHAPAERGGFQRSSFFFFITIGLELSETKVYEL